MAQSTTHDSATQSVRHWLLKSEPNTFSIDDLAASPNRTTCWEGVRNYQARNSLRDDFCKGDRVLFYHSACDQPAVVGTATVVKPGYPDHFAQDPKHHYHDPKCTAENPRWYMVDIKLNKKLERPVTLAEMRSHRPLDGMVLLMKGSRLSVQPVSENHFNEVLKMAERPQ